MFTISDILQDINRGILANNLVETEFSYRVVYFVNDGNKGTKFRVDTSYDGLRATMENIIRRNLTTTNSVVLAAITTRKSGETISLLRRSYSFSLGGYFRQIVGEEYRNMNYGRRRANG